MKFAVLLSVVQAVLGIVAADQWITEGFEAFRRGTFGNAGQNLYVSRAGVLQRIHLFDLDGNGWLDLPFANCQNHHESAPSYVYGRGGERVAALPAQGARSGLAEDLDGDGFTDLVIANHFDMVSPFAASDIYFGNADGAYSQRRHIRLQTPHCEDCCSGRFDGGRKALAFALAEHGIVRIYPQGDHGFEWRVFRDLEVKAELVCAADLDGDGFDDLCTRMNEATATTVFWGGPDGLDPARRTDLAALPDADLVPMARERTLQSELERKFVEQRLLERVCWRGRDCFTLSTGREVRFYSATKARQLEQVLAIDVPMAEAVAAGDFNGDGFDDLAFACQGTNSCICLGSADGFRRADRLAVATSRACAVDASGNDVLFAQCGDGRSYTNDSLLFSFTDGRLDPVPRRYRGEDAHRAFIVRNPGREERIFLVNHFSRSSVGFDRSYVYWGDRDGYDPKRRAEVPGWCAVDTLPADLDDDGRVELIVCNNSENSLDLDPGLFIHRFGPQGFEPGRSTALRTDIGWGAIVADFDRDGWLDIISSCNHWYDLRFFHGGPEGFVRHEDIEVQFTRGEDKRRRSGHARWPIAVDVNMDGWLDLVVPLIYEDRSFVLWGGPDGFSRERRQELAAFGCVSARAADLDGNGYPEVILGGHATQVDGNALYRSPHHSYVHVYWNGPDGLRETDRMILRTDAGDSISIADYNRDGWLDLFVGSYQGEIDRELNSYIYWNRKGAFDEFDRQEMVTHVVSGCISADFNEDGWIDLAAANHKVYGDHVGESYVWWNGPHGFCQRNVTRLPTCGPHGMCTYEPGNQLDRGPAEYYFSEPRRMEYAATVTGVVVEAAVPPKTWVKAKVRTAADAASLAGAEWREPGDVKVAAGALLQYRLELGSVNSLSTPRVSRVVVSFGGSDGE